MGKLLDDLRAAGQLGLYADYRTGSYIDQVGNCTATAYAGATRSPCWRRTSAGLGLYFSYQNQGFGSRIEYGNPVNLQIQDLTIFVAYVAEIDSTYAGLIGRYNDSINLFRMATGQFYGYSAGSGRATGLYSSVGSPSFGSFRYNGATGIYRAQLNGVFSLEYNFVSVFGTTWPWVIGNAGGGGETADGTILLAGIVKRSLTDTEMNQLYEEYMDEPHTGILPRRYFSFPYPGKTYEQYIKNSTFLDLSMSKNGNIVTNLAPTAYAPVTNSGSFDVSTNNVIFENKIHFPPILGVSCINCGLVTQIDNAEKLTFSFWINTQVQLSGRCVCGKYNGADNAVFYIGIWNDGTKNSIVYTQIEAGAANWKRATSPYIIRPGNWYHVVVVRDGGAGATDADRLKIYIDGALQTCVFTGPLPVLPVNCINAAAYNFAVGNMGAGSGPPANAIDFDLGSFRAEARAWTASEVLENYLEGAQKPVILDRGEDVPVSITNISSGMIPGSGFEVVSGNWSVVEPAATLDRRVNIENPWSGRLVTNSNQVTGTWYFRHWNGNGFSSTNFITDQQATTVENGYAVITWCTVGANIYVYTGGVPAAVGSWGGECTAYTLYEYCVTRDASGFIKLYQRGGSLTSWTLISSGTHNTYNSSKYVALTPSSYGGWALSQPGNKAPGFLTFRGVLDPTLGQLPSIIGSPWTPVDLGASLKGFYLASADKTIATGVSQWTDLSGNNNHLTQATPANQPAWSATSFNGRPGITFDGLAHYLKSNAIGALFAGNDTPVSIILAMQYASLANDKYLWSFGSSTLDTHFFTAARSAATKTVIYRAEPGSSATAISTETQDTNRHVWSYVFPGTTISVFMDGAATSISTAFMNTGNELFDQFSLGCLLRTIPEAYNSFIISGLIIYQGAISTQDRLNAENYLKNVCGV